MLNEQERKCYPRAAVDTLGHLWALPVTAAEEQDWAQVEKQAEQIQLAMG